MLWNSNNSINDGLIVCSGRTLEFSIMIGLDNDARLLFLARKQLPEDISGLYPTMIISCSVLGSTMEREENKEDNTYGERIEVA